MNLKEFITKNCINQKKMCEVINISQNTICSIHRGILVSEETAKKIIAFCNAKVKIPFKKNAHVRNRKKKLENSIDFDKLLNENTNTLIHSGLSNDKH